MGEEQDLSVHGLHDSGFVVADPPKFDLESYISNYDGHTRLERLTTIGTSSKILAADALKAALAEAKQGKNVNLYLDIGTYLQNISPDKDATLIDQEWVERTRKTVDKETERLESELKGYKNNLIKESIRMGTEELGAHYHSVGDFASSQRAYSRMREYCTTSKHLSEMNLKLALIHISQRNFMALQQAVYRIQNSQLSKADAAKLEPCLPPLLGLASLANGDYRAAAGHFLATDASFIGGIEPVAGGVLINRHVLSPNDVATYGTLAALATYDRAALRAHVLESPSFRQFLELEPHLRRAVTAFVSAKYTACLAALDAYRADYLLDLHLQRHVALLTSLIRRKSIVAFFAPFARVDIATMCDAFGGTPDALTAELAELVSSGLLDARVDAVAGVLVARGAASADQASERRAVADKALRVAAEHERAMRLRLWRIRLQSEGFEVKSKKLPAPDGMDDGLGPAGRPGPRAIGRRPPLWS